MDKNNYFRPRTRMFLIVSYFLWGATTLRWIMEYIEQDHPLIWLISALLLLYGVLMGLEPFLTYGASMRAHLYLAFQTTLVLVASLFYYELDFFAILYLPLCGQAFYLFERRTATIWASILVLATFVGQTIQFGWPEGLSFTFLYIAGLVFVGVFSTITIQAEESRRRSEELLEELREAHRQLQEYSGKAEELAVANERNRLARDLHDSVAQTLYGLTLQAEAASRRLESGRLADVADDLSEMRQSAQQTLTETRLLIFELRPPSLEKGGLIAALSERLEAVERRSGFKIHTDFSELGEIPENIEVNLYRIAQESLNNILKHAQASQVNITLGRERGKVILQISDNGIGFETSTSFERPGLGLKGIKERAEQNGGHVWFQSVPGDGSSIKVEVPL